MIRDMAVVDKLVEEDNKKLVKEYNDSFKILFCMVKNLAGDGLGCCCGRGGKHGDGGGQQEVHRSRSSMKVW